jgi:hypothetical protein
MLNSVFLAVRFLILVFSGHKQFALENVALRHQLAVAGEFLLMPQSVFGIGHDNVFATDGN